MLNQISDPSMCSRAICPSWWSEQCENDEYENENNLELNLACIACAQSARTIKSIFLAKTTPERSEFVIKEVQTDNFKALKKKQSQLMAPITKALTLERSRIYYMCVCVCVNVCSIYATSRVEGAA